MCIQGTVVWLLFTGSMLGWPSYVSGMKMTSELFLVWLTSVWPCLRQILQVRVWTEFRRTFLCPCSSASASGFASVFLHNMVTWQEGGLHIWWLTPVSIWAESASCRCYLVGAELWRFFSDHERMAMIITTVILISKCKNLSVWHWNQLSSQWTHTQVQMNSTSCPVTPHQPFF